jgi:hypothetical protein
MQEIKMWEKIKANLASLTATVSSIGVLFAAWLFLDERYAHAQTVKLIETQQVQQMQQLRKESQIQYRKLRIDSIDDKIFFLEQKHPRTAQDEALLNRYRKQREDEAREMRTEMRALEAR